MAHSDACEQYLQEHDAQQLDALREFLRIPSISSLPEHRDASPHGQPHYVPVAELLVGRGRITRDDVERQRSLRTGTTDLGDDQSD